MRVVFLGTPDFSVPVLEKIADNFEVVGVITQPDRPRERGKVTPTPVKECAERLGLPVFCFEKIKEHVEEIKALSPDVMVTAAYGQILNRAVLEIAPVINVHASLLPKYRGSSPIQWAVINDEKETGVTIMKTELGVDTGDMILQKVVPIGENETAGELFDRLAPLGAEAVCEALTMIGNGTAVFTPQDDALATHCTMLKKEDGFIDFQAEARFVASKIRGMTPWPSAFSTYKGETYKLFNPRVVSMSGKAGQILCADKTNGLVVACKEGAVSFDVQKQGGKKMPITEFLKGHSFEIGAFFGE